jgi:glycosyltransferase involved in cell wall biosynthesis
MPFAALEAMSAGLPVVASDSGSLPEIVGPERCVPRGDPQALAAAIKALYGDPERRRHEGDALIERARRRFGEQRYVDDLLALYAGTHAHA